MFVNVMENLDWGILTYIYWPTSQPIEKPTICRHLFPITIKNIYSGCIEGEDRIITRHSGRYSLGTSARPVVYLYDENGMERLAMFAQRQ